MRRDRRIPCTRLRARVGRADHPWGDFDSVHHLGASTLESRLRTRLRASLVMSPEERLRSLDATLSRLWSARRRWTDAYPEDGPLWEEYIRRLDTMDPDVVLRTIAALEEILPGASAAGDDEVRRRLARGE